MNQYSFQRILLHCQMNDSEVVKDFPFKWRHVCSSFETADRLKERQHKSSVKKRPFALGEILPPPHVFPDASRNSINFTLLVEINPPFSPSSCSHCSNVLNRILRVFHSDVLWRATNKNIRCKLCLIKKHQLRIERNLHPTSSANE